MLPVIFAVGGNQKTSSVKHAAFKKVAPYFNSAYIFLLLSHIEPYSRRWPQQVPIAGFSLQEYLADHL